MWVVNYRDCQVTYFFKLHTLNQTNAAICPYDLNFKVREYAGLLGEKRMGFGKIQTKYKCIEGISYENDNRLDVRQNELSSYSSKPEYI